jgi:hypothetical protein
MSETDIAILKAFADIWRDITAGRIKLDRVQQMCVAWGVSYTQLIEEPAYWPYEETQ